MRVIDRYLVRQFLQVFTVCFVSLVGLYVVIDAFGHLDELLGEAQRQKANLLAVVSKFYAYQSLGFFNRISGVLGLISAMFTVTWLQRHNELTALLAAGIPKPRVMAPILVGAMGVSLLATANRELIIPRVRHELGRDSYDPAGQKGRGVQPQRDRQTGILIDGERLFPEAQRLERATFFLPQGPRVKAKEAQYQPRRSNRPGGYLLTAVSHPPDLVSGPSIVREGQPLVLTPVDTDWLAPDTCFVVSGVDPDMLVVGTAWWQNEATLALIRGLNRGSVDFGADVRVAIHTRILQPLLDATLLFLGLPLILSRDNRNMFLAIGLCIVVVVLFMLVMIACQYLGSSGLIRPALAPWLPLLVFVPVAVLVSKPLLR